MKLALVRKIKAFCLVFAALFIVVGADPATAQEILLPVPPNSMTLTVRQNQIVGRLQARPVAIAVRIMRINSNALNSNRPVLSLPNIPRIALEASPGPSDGSVALRPVESRDAISAIFILRDNDLLGSVVTPDDAYEVSPIGGGLHAVTRIDQSRFPPEEEPGAYGNDVEAVAVPAPRSSSSQSDPRITILVEGTAAARAWAAQQGYTFAHIADVAMAQVNQAFDFPRGSHSVRAFVSYAGGAPQSSTIVEAGRPVEGVLPEFATDPDTRQRRVTEVADVAILIMWSPGQTGCGMARGIYPEPRNAYAVVSIHCILANYSFAHELGHLLGLRHNTERDPITTPFRAGHGYINRAITPWFTLMAYSCPGCGNRQLFYSNPNQVWLGQPTGDNDERNSVSVLNITAPIVAAYGGANIVRYGKAYMIQNGYSHWSGGFLTLFPIRCGENPRCALTTSESPPPFGGLWTLISISGVPDGEVVQPGDLVHFRALDLMDGGFYYLDTRGSGCHGDLYCVSASASPDRDSGSGSWRIGREPGDRRPIYLLDEMTLENEYRSLGGDLQVADGPCWRDLLCLSTVSSSTGQSGRTLWRFRQVP